MQVLGLAVSDGFFETMRLPLRRGRPFAPSDHEAAPKVFAVNDTFARRLLAAEDPIGQTVTLPEGEGRIVAVVADMTYVGLSEPTEPTVFYPWRQQQRIPRGVFEVRTTVPPLSVLSTIGRIVTAIDSRLPVSDAKTQAAQLDESIRSERGLTTLAVFLALVAVLLSCIGLYGVMAHHVARRSGEIAMQEPPEPRARFLLGNPPLASTAIAQGVDEREKLVLTNRSNGEVKLGERAPRSQAQFDSSVFTPQSINDRATSPGWSEAVSGLVIAPDL